MSYRKMEVRMASTVRVKMTPEQKVAALQKKIRQVKALDENGWHQLGVGFQGTYLNKRLDVANLKLEDMLQSDGFTGVTGESFTSQQMSVSYVDANAGIFYGVDWLASFTRKIIAPANSRLDVGGCGDCMLCTSLCRGNNDGSYCDCARVCFGTVRR